MVKDAGAAPAAREVSDRIHGFPAGQHQELDFVTEKTLAPMRADKSRRVHEFGNHLRSKAGWIRFGGVRIDWLG